MRVLLLFLLAITTTAAGAAEKDAGLLPNPGFDKEMSGWVFRPGDPSLAAIVDAGGERGKVLELHPDGKILGVETEKLELGKALEADAAYEVTALLKNEEIKNGVFAFSMYCYDAAGKALRQIAFYGLNTKSAPHDWKRVRGEFGKGSANPLPEGTASICIRFSFYEKSGNCQAKVLVDDVILKKHQPAVKNDWPAEVVADVGDLQVRFESRSFWTLYRIDYQGTRLCHDRWGSHYGTVAFFPGVGFIGSGHTENENEEVLSRALEVDGKPVAQPETTYRCRKIVLRKESKVRTLHYKTTITVADNRIWEEVILKADEPTKVDLIYHFMHPWTHTATEYLAEMPDGTRVEGSFTDSKKLLLDKPAKWSAIYDAPSGKGAVTYVLEVPEAQPWSTLYWDQPERYRKHYLRTFVKSTVPANEELRYRIVTVPFAAAAEKWKEEAAKVAATCAPGS